MHIVLIDLLSSDLSYSNKEMNGGLGRRIELDHSLRSRMLLGMSKSMFYTPPISLAYIAAIFEKRGFHVSLSRTPDIPQNTDAVIFQSSIVDYRNDLSAAKELKKKYPRLSIGFTGTFPTFVPEMYLDAGDFVISGEPEGVAQKLWESVPPSGVIQSEKEVELDQLPFPKWDIFLDQENHLKTGGNLRGLPIYSTRGCSFTCGYCPYVSYFGRTRIRSIENVYSEIDYIVKRWGIKRFLFRDPDFTENRKRVLALTDAILKGNHKIQWSCETRLDLLDEELLSVMKKAGCIEIGTGIESSNSEILKDVERKAIVDDKIRRMTEYALKIGIIIQGNYILGFPEDTLDTIRKTIQYAKQLNTPLANFCIFTPYPGTNSWSKFKEDIIEKDFQKFDLAHMVYQHKTLDSETIKQCYIEAFKSYYFRFSWLKKNLLPILKHLRG